MKNGLSRQRWIESIETFVREHGRTTPRWAVICTYECDIALLDRYVLPVLTRRGRAFRTVVLADAGALETRLGIASPPRGRVNLHAVRLRKGGIFHPKLVFLRAGSAARACFGSANLSFGGFGANLEVWTYSDDGEIIEGVAHFLSRLTAHPHITLEAACRRHVERALSGVVPRRSDRVWSSLDETFLDRFHATRTPVASTLTVVSPALASANGIRMARAVFPQPEATIYTDEPIAVASAQTRVYKPSSPADSESADAPEYPLKLHTKLYLLRNARHAHVWVGSANFTAQALTKTVATGGNVECLFRSDIPHDEATALLQELDTVFKQPTQLRQALSSVREEIPRAVSNIIGCELSNGRHGLALIVWTVAGTNKVELEHAGCRLTIPIRSGRGIVEGEALRRGFPNLDFDGPSVVLLHEVIGRRRIPVILNLPHVPEPNVAGQTQAQLDAFLDELRGHLPPPRNFDKEEIEEEQYESEEEKGPDTELEKVERRLDEVRHQGELDRLAVKAALAKRLILKSTEPGQLRSDLLKQGLAACLKASPSELHPILTKLFKK